MSQKIAADILAGVGPGRILHYGCTTSDLISALLQKGCDAYGYAEQSPDQPAATLDGRISAKPPTTPFDTVILDPQMIARHPGLRELFEFLRPLVACNLVLLPGARSSDSAPRHADLLSRAATDSAAIAAGYRRHLAAFEVPDYERRNLPLQDEPMYFQIIPTQVLERWPQDTLLAGRDLHMDMSRESGPRADAHLVRYALAADWVRPSDTVLDCACGLGYGTALLAARSSGLSFIGVDIDPASITYARDNFSGYQVEYRAAAADSLHFLQDHSVDTVVSFETLEHLEDYAAFLAEAVRVLKPDGRIIVSVPNQWVDESGADPNPHHHHVFDYEKCRSALARHFIVEARYAQTAPGGMKLAGAPRKLQRLPLPSAEKEVDAEWWIVVASVNPLKGASVPFSRPEYDRCTEGTASKVADFEAYYDNPWLYRAWMQIGLRLSDEKTLDAVIAQALPGTAPDSADRGGLLAVAAYAALRDNAIGDYDRILRDIAGYLEYEGDNPHVLRWCISLEFVSALLCLASGGRDEARRHLIAVTSSDPLRFSPLIATKLVAAHFLAGTMHLVDGNEESAREAFAAGIEAARRALHAPDEDAIGNPRHPLPFGFTELAEIADMACQCAMAIDALPRFRRSPARFWRSVDARRFAMISWLQALQAHNSQLDAEIAALRNELQSMRSTHTVRALLPIRIKEMVQNTSGRLRRLFARDKK
jgi:2-polyprenyl-3-methyl-5-hydroxy-6-metoxy-1,4-benzoquinol methylase